MSSDFGDQTDTKKMLERIKKQAGYSNDKELAEALGMSQYTPNTWKARNSVPYKQLIGWAHNHNYSLDWMFLNRGHAKNHLYQNTPYSTQEQDGVYHVEKRLGNIKRLAKEYDLNLTAEEFDLMFMLDTQFNLGDEWLVKIIRVLSLSPSAESRAQLKKNND
ncbi:helix-turn-helix domain-containing protein [Pleionea sp. CnH1-48]|uniref:helix-turn-helix domain-containing protein n=1 Tax=Pleionea sp. CnH1-48 TaxID=2954494 RepID=UPI002096CCF8|nr:helix-turn-helix domain-containing protein [Pleionea sp. CnH1-48]MCO7223087.1 helix-turn-helix domain containing protein [Pleionea sp. CnH1-48]